MAVRSGRRLCRRERITAAITRASDGTPDEGTAAFQKAVVAARVAPSRNTGQRRTGPPVRPEPAGPPSQRAPSALFLAAVSAAVEAEEVRRYQTGERVVRDQTLRGIVLRVARAIVEHPTTDFDGGESWPSNRALAEAVGLTVRSVQNAKRALRIAGFLSERWRGTNLPGRAGGVPVASVYELRTPLADQQAADETAVAAHPARPSERGARRRARDRELRLGLRPGSLTALTCRETLQRAAAPIRSDTCPQVPVDDRFTPPRRGETSVNKKPVRAAEQEPQTGAASPPLPSEFRRPWLTERQARLEGRRAAAERLRAALPDRLGCLSLSWLASAAYGVGWLVDLGWTVDDIELWLDRWPWPADGRYNPRSLIRWRLDRAREHAREGLARPTYVREQLHQQDVQAHQVLVDELTDPSRIAIHDTPPDSAARKAWLELRKHLRTKKQRAGSPPVETVEVLPAAPPCNLQNGVPVAIADPRVGSTGCPLCGRSDPFEHDADMCSHCDQVWQPPERTDHGRTEPDIRHA